MEEGLMECGRERDNSVCNGVERKRRERVDGKRERENDCSLSSFFSPLLLCFSSFPYRTCFSLLFSSPSSSSSVFDYFDYFPSLANLSIGNNANACGLLGAECVLIVVIVVVVVVGAFVFFAAVYLVRNDHFAVRSNTHTHTYSNDGGDRDAFSCWKTRDSGACVCVREIERRRGRSLSTSEWGWMNSPDWHQLLLILRLISTPSHRDTLLLSSLSPSTPSHPIHPSYCRRTIDAFPQTQLVPKLPDLMLAVLGYVRFHSVDRLMTIGLKLGTDR